MPPQDGPAPARIRHRGRCLILLCAEQGFADAFSERVLDAVKDDIAGATIFLMGARGLAVAEERGIRPVWHAPMATSAAAIPALANRVADALYRQIADASVVAVDVAFSHIPPGSGAQIDRHSLLPVDLARFPRQVRTRKPLTTLAPAALLERLAAEYVYAQLCQAVMHAFAAENEARMLAMAAARTHIESKLGALSHEHRLRQEEITTEIVELAAGAETLSKRG
jgi:F-type H+-transporting ATPase subunit gamma